MQNRFMDWFGLSAPILQAPIGSMASVALVTAVARGGGLGSLAMTCERNAPRRPERTRSPPAHAERTVL